MKLDFRNERVLAVVAHPDDAELLCAGTLARAKANGAEIGIGVLCLGDKGQPGKAIKSLASIRRQEMTEAASLLDARLYHGGFRDGELADTRVERLKVIDIFREFNPTLVFAHSPKDYHPDHRAASVLAEAASWFCASRGHRTRSTAMTTPPALWWMDTINMTGFEPGFYVDISAHASLKEQMLGCHKSQLARGNEGDFSPLTDLMRLQFQARGAQAGVAAAEAFQAHHAFKRSRAW
jgi:LmbE family N-acetylglucosaminyl deacetylase